MNSAGFVLNCDYCNPGGETPHNAPEQIRGDRGCRHREQFATKKRREFQLRASVPSSESVTRLLVRFVFLRLRLVFLIIGFSVFRLLFLLQSLLLLLMLLLQLL
jgi:hypothetical protein